MRVVEVYVRLMDIYAMDSEVHVATSLRRVS